MNDSHWTVCKRPDQEKAQPKGEITLIPLLRKHKGCTWNARVAINEIWLRVQQMMQGSDIGIQEKNAKLFNEWERFTSNEGESIESYYHRFLKLMNDLKRNKQFPKKIASNLKFLNNLQPEWSRHVTIIHQNKDLHTADYTQLYDFLKYNQKEVDELKAKRLAKTQDPLALMANSNNPYVFPAPHQDQSSFNQNYLQQPMPNPEDITKLLNTNQQQSEDFIKPTQQADYTTGYEYGSRQTNADDPTTAMNMALALMAKAFKLNYSTPTNNNQRISSNPRNRQIAQPGMNMGQDRQMQMIGGNGGNQFRQYAAQNAKNLNGYNEVHNVENQVAPNPRVQNVGNLNGLIGVQGNGIQNQIGNVNLVAVRAEGNAAGQNGNQIRCYNCRGIGHYARNCIARPRRRDAAYLQTQLLIAQKEEAGIQLFAMSTQQEIYAAGSESRPSVLNKENYVPWSSCLLRFTSNEGESIESYYHRFLKLMNDLKRNKQFPKKIASNLKFLNNLQPEWSRHVTIIHQNKDLHTADYTQLYDFLKYNQKEVDELKAKRLAKTQDPLALMANSNNPYVFLAPHQD
nr:hypothetical protein [Tanacetum cinerariifolium]